MGDQRKLLALPGPALAVVTISGVKQKMKDVIPRTLDFQVNKSLYFNKILELYTLEGYTESNVDLSQSCYQKKRYLILFFFVNSNKFFKFSKKNCGVEKFLAEITTTE